MKKKLIPIIFILVFLIFFITFIAELITPHASLFAIIKGTPVTRDETVPTTPDKMKDLPKNPGVVYLTGSDRKCTGTLLNNNILLTARHCVRTVNPATKRVNVLFEEYKEDGTYNRQNRRVKHLVKRMGKGWKNDIALLSVETPFEIEGKTEGFIRPLFPGYNDELIGTPIACYGYGRNTTSSGLGKLRRALMTITDYDPVNEILYMLPNKQEQILTSGDSGCPCFHITPQLTLATVHHKSDKTRTPQRKVTAIKRDYESGPDTFRDWISRQVLSDYSKLNFFVQVYLQKTRSLQGITYLPTGKEIPITIRAESRQGISSIVWSISSKDAQSGNLSLLKKGEQEVPNTPTAEFKTQINSIKSETYVIEAKALDAHIKSETPEIHEVRTKIHVKFVSAEQKPVCSINIKGSKNTQTNSFTPGKPIFVNISAQSDAGIFQVGYGIQTKKKNGKYHGAVTPGTRPHVKYPRSAKKVNYTWKLVLSKTGSYRIYVFSRDVLYGTVPGHQSLSAYHYIKIVPEKKPK